MPSYNYKCLKCGIIFTLFQSMMEKNKQNCDACGGKVKRIISGGTGMIFKGNGFYLTDYARKKNNEKNNNKSTKNNSNLKEKKYKKSGESSE